MCHCLVKMSYQSDKSTYEKQVLSWIKAAATQDVSGLKTITSVFMGTDGSSSARSATASDVVGILATNGYPLDVKITFYSTRMVKQTTKPYIAHNVTVEGRTYKKIALMNGKGDSAGVVYNVTLRWRKDLTPVFKWTTNKRGVSVLQGTRPTGRGQGYHYKYWYVPTSSKAALQNICRQWGDAVYDAYGAKGVSGANIVVSDMQNDPLVIYRRNRSAMQRLKLKRTTRTDEYAGSPSSSASPSSSTGPEEMDREGGGGQKRSRPDDEAGPSNNPGYVSFMPSPPPPSVPPPSVGTPGLSPYTPASYEPINSVTVIPDSPAAPQFSPFTPEHNSVPPFTEPHIPAKDAIDETIEYFKDHPSVLADLPILEWSHDQVMHDTHNEPLDDAVQAYEQDPSYEGLMRIVHLDPNGYIAKLKFVEMMNMASINGVPAANLDDMCKLYHEMGSQGDTFPQYIEELIYRKYLARDGDSWWFNTEVLMPNRANINYAIQDEVFTDQGILNDLPPQYSTYVGHVRLC